jgi:MYXO-CTERM domain-containing protein
MARRRCGLGPPHRSVVRDCPRRSAHDEPNRGRLGPDEPAWDELPNADAVSDATPLDRRCTCGTQLGDQGPAALLGLGLLGLGLRTRRRRPVRSHA